MSSISGFLNIYWHIRLFKKFGIYRRSVKSDGHDIKETFHVSQWKTSRCPKISLRCPGYPPLFRTVHIILRRSLYAAAAGLDLHKMYSNDIGAYYIYLQMAVSPVALKYRMSLLLQQTACYILSPLPYCTSVMLSTLHSPSSFLTTALLSLLLSPVSKV